MASKYSVHAMFWTRSDDGDDWILGSHWFHYDNLQEAIDRVKQPFTNTKDLIKSELYSILDNKDLIYSKDWESGEVVDYTLALVFDYHNREYDT